MQKGIRFGVWWVWYKILINRIEVLNFMFAFSAVTVYNLATVKFATVAELADAQR